MITYWYFWLPLSPWTIIAPADNSANPFVCHASNRLWFINEIVHYFGKWRRVFVFAAWVRAVDNRLVCTALLSIMWWPATEPLVELVSPPCPRPPALNDGPAITFLSLCMRVAFAAHSHLAGRTVRELGMDAALLAAYYTDLCHWHAVLSHGFYARTRTSPFNLFLGVNLFM